MRHSVQFGVVGLDLSLKRAAACYVPADWEPCDWPGLKFCVTGSSVKGRDPRAVVERLSSIAREISSFVDEIGCPKVWLEDYGFGAVHAAAWLGEGAGVVKLALFETHGIVVVPVNQATARKTFLGKLPRREAGTAVVQALAKLGFPWEGSDEADAWVIGNHARSVLGMPALTLGNGVGG